MTTIETLTFFFIWLESENALDNFLAEIKMDIEDRHGVNYRTLITRFFIWEKSSQGLNYWVRLHNSWQDIVNNEWPYHD